MAELCQRYPGQFHAGQARTLQRRFRDWRALHGPQPEMYFEQVAVPGREAAIDFTHGTDLRVTIAGAPLPHLLFEFVLSYSGWRWVAVAFGETFEALVAEQAHRRLKAVVAQALVVRGHADFATLAAYEVFVRDAVDRGSRTGAARVATDRAALGRCP